MRAIHLMSDEKPYDPFLESRLHDAEHKLAMSRKEANAYCGEIAALKKLLIAASHALRSYQFCNSSPDLAQSTADEIDKRLG